MVVPVITVRSSAVGREGHAGAAVSLGDIPLVITNRIFSVKISLASLVANGVPVRPVLVTGDAQVGAVGMALGADFDRTTGIAVLAPGVEATLGFVVDDDEANEAKIVVLDPATDAELY